MADENTTLLKVRSDTGELRADMRAARAEVVADLQAMKDQLAALEALGSGGQEQFAMFKAFGVSDAEALAAAQQFVAREHQAATAAILSGEAERKAAAEASAEAWKQVDAVIASAESRPIHIGGNLAAGMKAVDMARSGTGFDARFADEDARRAGTLESLAAAEMTAEAVAAEELAEAQDHLSDATEQAEYNQRAFQNVLRQFSPQLAGLVGLLGNVQKAMGFLLSPAGLALAGAGLAAAAIVKVNAVLQEAEERLASFMQQMERIRTGARTEERGVAGAAAAAGLPVAALGKARSIAARLEERGIERSTAEQVAPYLVDAQGAERYSEEEQFRAAAAVQAGLVEAPKAKFGTERQREAAMRRIINRTGKGPRAEGASNAAQQLLNQQVTELENAARGADTEVESFVAGETGLEGEELRKRAGTVGRQLREGLRPATVESTEAGDVLIPGDSEDVLTAAIRQRRDQASGQLSRLRETSDPEMKALLQRIAENTERTADNSGQPPQVNVNVGAGGAPVPRGGPGPRIR